MAAGEGGSDPGAPGAGEFLVGMTRRTSVHLRDVLWGFLGGAVPLLVLLWLVTGPAVPGVLRSLDHHEGAGAWVGAAASLIVGGIALGIALLQRRWQRQDGRSGRAAASLGCCGMAVEALKTVDGLEAAVQEAFDARSPIPPIWMLELEDASRQVEIAIDRYPVPDHVIMGQFLKTKRFVDMSCAMLEEVLEDEAQVAGFLFGLITGREQRVEVRAELRRAMAGFVRHI